jgi:fused signal recognition particle receptor
MSDENASPPRSGWLSRLVSGLTKSSSRLVTGITEIFTKKKLDDAALTELEDLLITADLGTATASKLTQELARTRFGKEVTAEEVRMAFAADIAKVLEPVARPLSIDPAQKPFVILVVGVNGAGKTTTIGKLTRHLVDAGQKVLLAAADTFRAAAREQLAVWAERADDPAAAKGRVEIVSQEGGDPAGVTYDAVVAGKARGCDVVIADTAGRLTTQAHLMEELKKIRRVIAKAEPGAPHEVLLVLDGNTGQNALAQLEAFDAALQVTGLVVTKLDGTARGGVLAAVALWARNRPRPPAVYFIGVGEKLEDLQTFDAREFANALLA